MVESNRSGENNNGQKGFKTPSISLPKGGGAMSVREQVKIALIGAGGWGKQHARIFSARDDVDFCAVVGRNPEKTKQRADAFGTRAYTGIQEMLDKEQPDLVSMCLPNQGHFEATLQVLQAGFPLLVEKPLVFDLREAEILLNEAAKQGVFFAINFNHRYAMPNRCSWRMKRSGLAS